jgi:hypothetical protein
VWYTIRGTSHTDAGSERGVKKEPSVPSDGSADIPVRHVGAASQLGAQSRGCGTRSEAPLPTCLGAARFAKFAVAAFLLAGLISILPVIIGRGEWVTFTWLGPARWQFAIYGFFAIAVFACIYCSLSEFAGQGDELPRLANVQFWLASSGTLLIGLPLAGAGIIQALKLRNPDIAFVDVSKATLHFLRLSTVGDLLIVAANVILLFSIISCIARSCSASARAVIADSTAEVPR